MAVDAQLGDLEFRRMFNGELDPNNAFLEIQAGSGGTEAQDWAEMLLRMYLKWAEQRGFTAEIIELSPGEVAGIKGATVAVAGEYAYGWLRTETGVHRLVRKSPFDSGNRRHTSFASVFVSAEIDEEIEIEINPVGRAHRHVSGERRRRPAREQDRLGDSYDAPADEHRRAMSERAVAASEPRQGVEAVAREAV